VARPVSLKEKRRLLEEFKSSRGNKKIRDLETIAEAFGCKSKITEKHENQIFIPPYSSINVVVVAIPHSNQDVLKKYVSWFVHMLEDILDHEMNTQGGGLND
jgi:hypothetical protein